VLGRALSGGGIFMTEYSVPSGDGLIAFAAKVPGQIVQTDVQPGHDGARPERCRRAQGDA
jgi:uncharacterized protein (AIM24 family)